MHVLGAVRHERPHRGGREPHDGYPVTLDQRPETVRLGIVGHALEEDGRAAVEEPRRDEHRAHQPAEIRQPEETIARAHVHQVAEVVGALEEEAALREHRALRPARRAGRVDDEARAVKLDGQRGAGVRLPADQLVPPGIAPLGPRNLAPEPLVDDHVLDRRRCGHGLVGGLLHPHDLAAAVEAVGRDERLRLAVLQP